VDGLVAEKKPNYPCRQTAMRLASEQSTFLATISTPATFIFGDELGGSGSGVDPF